MIDLATLQKGVNRVVLECEAAELGLPPEEWRGRVRAELSVERTGEQVTVRGALDGLAGLDCVRCLRPFEQAIHTRLEVYADRAGVGRHVDQERELERDDYMKFHDGRFLDVGDEAREALILELPMAPRCRESCLGLCPRCGADRNEGPCGCAI